MLPKKIKSRNKLPIYQDEGLVSQNTSPFSNETYDLLNSNIINPDYEQSLSQNNIQQAIPQTIPTPTQEPAGMSFASAIPVIGKIGLGVYNLIQARKEKKKQQKYENNYKADLAKKFEQVRTNDYYYTPYMQLGGNMDAEMQQLYGLYNAGQEKNLILNSLQQSYIQQNLMKRANWMQQRNQGYSNLASAGTDALKLAASFLQEGGNTTDIYSSDFVRTPRRETNFPQETTQESAQEEYVYDAFNPDADIDDIKPQESRYDFSNLETSVYDTPLRPAEVAAEKFKMLGLKPSSVSGDKHNKGSLHYRGRALDLGLNTTFNGDEAQMESFIEWWNLGGSELFPGASLHDERTKPEGQEVWTGKHFHIEFEE